jgi:S1-C subfamily serine protease
MTALARRTRWALTAVLLAALVAASADVVHAQRRGELPSYLLEDERNTIGVFEQAAQSVVFITNTVFQRRTFSRSVMEVPVGSGSGFLWDDEGHVVTNYHVLQNGNRFTVTLANGKAYDAMPVGGDARKDLAVLRIEAPEGELRALPLGTSRDLAVGQKVIAIGNPFGLDQTLTTGVVSALGREIRSVANTPITDVIQTDASINPGNSGGPLLDSRGYLIGVNTAIYGATGANVGIGFAVPVSTVKRIVPQLIQYGEVRRAVLGVEVLDDAMVRRLRLEDVQGVILTHVLRGGPAAEAGLEPASVDRRGRIDLGDVIVAIDDHEVKNFDDLLKALDLHEPGDEVVVRIRNGDRRRDIPLRLAEM